MMEQERREKFSAALSKVASPRVSCQEYGLRQFINLCLQHEYRQLFFFLPSALRAVTSLLTSQNEVTVMLSFHLLSHLAMDTERSGVIATREVLGHVMDVLRSPANPDLLEKCLWLTLTPHRGTGAALVAMTESGVTTVLMELLRSSQLAIIQTAANTLQNLISSTKCPAPAFLDNQRTFCRMRGVNVAIELLSHERTEIASASLGLFNSLTTATGENEVTVKKIVMVSGALPVLVSLASPEGDPVLRDRALFVLVSLSTVAGYERKFIEAGAAVPLIELLSDPATSDKSRTLALILLQNLSASADVRRALHFSGAVRALAEMLRANRADTKQTTHLLHSIANLAVDETIRLEMADAGMITAVAEKAAQHQRGRCEDEEYEEALRSALDNVGAPVSAAQRSMIMSDAMARFKDLCPSQAPSVFCASSAPRLSCQWSPKTRPSSPQARFLRPMSPPTQSPRPAVTATTEEALSSPELGSLGSPPLPERKSFEAKQSLRRSSFINAKGTAAASPRLASGAHTAAEDMAIDKIQKVSQLNSIHISRTHIAREILQTEQTYVRSLDSCIKHFVEPLTAPGSFLSPEVTGVLFCNLREVHRINSSFLSMLEDRMRDWTGSTILGDLFTTLFKSNMMDRYVAYINNFDTALALVGQLNEEMPAYRQYSDEMKLKNNLDLASLLVTPIQRIPRYILLLKSLLKRTPPMHPDCVLLNKAFAGAKDLTDRINEAKRSSENSRKVAELETRLLGLSSSLVAPGRLFVRQGLLIQVSTQDTSIYCFAVLLSDVLLLTAQEKTKYRVKYMMPVAELVAIPLPGTEEIQNLLCVSRQNQSWIFSASSLAERDEWVSDLQKNGASSR
eukprot:m51a1_g1718 hypothetical protein (853) ;mRNA; f:50801-54712